tara:strand:+ start:1344 stop:2072 length:729 start_codon:yes stop_codon:yes gene_type:complete
MARSAKPWEELTKEQQVNRMRNERAKENKIKPKTNLISISNRPTAPVRKPTGITNWNSILTLSLHPFTAAYTLSILSLSSYLTFQFYLHSELTTGLTIEFLAIIFAAIFSLSTGFSRYFSFLCAVAVIFYSSVCLHQGMAQGVGDNSELLNSIRTQRLIVLDQIQTAQSNIKNSPENHISSRTKNNEGIDKYKKELNRLDSKIANSKINISSDYSNIMIRVLCMLANMILIHRYVNFIKEHR